MSNDLERFKHHYTPLKKEILLLIKLMTETRDKLPRIKYKHDDLQNSLPKIIDTAYTGIPEQILKQYAKVEAALIEFAKTDNRIKAFDPSDKRKAKYIQIKENLYKKNILKDKSFKQRHNSVITNINALQNLHKSLKKNLSKLSALMNDEKTKTMNCHNMKKNIRRNIKDYSKNINLELLDKKTLLDLKKCQEMLIDCLAEKKHAIARLQKDYARGMNLINSIIEMEQCNPDQIMNYDYNPFKDNLIVINLDKCIKNESEHIESLEKKNHEIMRILSEKENDLLADKQNDLNPTAEQLEELEKTLIAEHEELTKYLKNTVKFPIPKNITESIKLYKSILDNLKLLEKINASSPDSAKQTMERLHESGIIKNDLEETQNHVRDQKRDLRKINIELCKTIEMTQALLDTRKESAERLHKSAIAGLSYEDYGTISDHIDKVLNDSSEVEYQISKLIGCQKTIIPKLELILSKERNEQNITNEQNLINEPPVINSLSDALAHEKQVIDNINKLREYYLHLLKEKETSITQIRRFEVALTNSLSNTKQHTATDVSLVSAITEKRKNSALSLNSLLNSQLTTEKRQSLSKLITANNTIDKKLRNVFKTFYNMTSARQEKNTVCSSENPSFNIRDLVLPKYSSLNTELRKQKNADLVL